MTATYEIASAPRIITGPGALEQLPDVLAALGAQAVVLVSDHGVAQAGLVARVDELLRDRFAVHTHIAPPGEPVARDVDAAAALARSVPGAAVVGLGGGTALDIAKLVAATTVAAEPLDHYFLCSNPYAGKRASVMIPTTSGTGAEVTRTAICSNIDGHKLWCWGHELLPDLVLMDPTLMTSLLPTVTATTGLDALVHAIEAVTGQRRNAIAGASGLHAIRLVTRHLPEAVAAPGDVATRQRLQEAACLAGLAIENCGTGVAHALGHALGSAYHVPHGIAVAVSLQAALPWNIVGNAPAFDAVAVCFDATARAADVPRLYDELLSRTRFAEAMAPFREIRLDVAELTAASLLPENTPMAKNNTRVADEAALAQLCQRLAATWEAWFV